MKHFCDALQKQKLLNRRKNLWLAGDADKDLKDDEEQSEDAPEYSIDSRTSNFITALKRAKERT